ncbi:cellulase family glycosylhydrolase [Curtobacterium sp. MCPF17_052]|uniref:glycoside hydrolase 5 family protein n=1 Tax=Curtobacterium sp. MCPF17_052 TaxID=2175655 RepID=UPI0024E01CF9|nr:cellulase family glycosylhydrolase [Curtobacterium sp. MCPF17_052]WIB12135.1 cellulase family glycosylhydrolase [Curtobacterium sp. MCPF17_052]
MRFGVNHTPSNGWFHSWLDFSPSDTARDLEAIASLGADHVRIFPLWPVVQPNRTLIRPSALEDVATVVDIAGSFGLDVNVDALQGHLSSFDFVPSWLESWHRRNMFTDPDVVASTAAYVRALAAAVADRPNLLGITIGNEVNQFAHAPHPAPFATTAEQGHAWAAAMVDAARAGLGDGREARSASVPPARRPLVTLAQYDAAWYDDAQPFGPEHAAEHGDATVTHSWVFNGAARLHGALGAGSVRHGEYLLQLAAAWNGRADRPNWLQEVGAPTNVVDVADAPTFTEQTIRHALDVQELSGITWWCSHDVSRSLADFPELEYDLGLLTNDGRVKPTGGAVPRDGAGVRRRPLRRPPPRRRPRSFSTMSPPTGQRCTAPVSTPLPAAGSPPPGSRSPSRTGVGPRWCCAPDSPTPRCSQPAASVPASTCPRAPRRPRSRSRTRRPCPDRPTARPHDRPPD